MPERIRFPFFVLTDDPTWIAIGDAVRLLVMVLGFILLASSVWLYRNGLIRKDPASRWRVLFMVLAIISIVGTEYNRLHQPVTTRIIINGLALLCCFVAVVKSLSEKPPTRIETD